MTREFRTAIVAGLIAIGAINSPWMVEGADNNCGAVEQLAMRMTATKGDAAAVWASVLLKGLSNGRFAEAAALNNNPDTPAAITCGLAYWRASLNKEEFAKWK